jgi:hypothetical protein
MRLALCVVSGLSLLACSNEERVALPSASAQPRPSVPEIAVPHVGAHDAAMAIDGRRAEPQWQRAARIDAFVDAGSGGTPGGSGPRAQAWLFWDDDALFVFFSVQDTKVRGGFPKDATDPHLWERDTIEIMLDPDGDGDNRDYYEIQINPQNLVFDSQFDGYNSPRTLPDGPFGNQDWRSELVSAVVIDGTIDDDADTDGGYTVEAKLPWKSFGKAKSAPPKAGDVWRANFYAMEDNGGVAWSPILGQGNFHRASRFGRLVFSPPKP